MKQVWMLMVVATLFSCQKENLEIVNNSSQTITLKGDIVTNTTLTANNEYIIEENVYVKNCSQLTIEPGTVIKSSNGSKLIIEQCSKIIANGTSNKPIVFTSSKPSGQKSPGDFGGVIILGYATTNQTNAIFNGYQCLNLPYGGNNDNDNSGILRYVRIEYGGISLPAQLDIGALTLGGVGKGTTIEYVQTIYSGDCSFYFMGGSINVNNLYAYASGDDDYSFDYGYNGIIRNSIGKKDKNYCHQPVIGESFNGGNSIECKNNGSTTNPTYPKLDNMLLVLDSSILRIGTGLYVEGVSKFELTNSIITEWNSVGVMLLNSYESTQFYKNNNSKLTNNKFGSMWGNRCYWSLYSTLMTTNELKTKAQQDGNVETYMTKQQTESLSKPSWTNNWCSFSTIGR